jgi:hypothetical protein
MKPEIFRGRRIYKREKAVLEVKNKELNISRLADKKLAKYLPVILKIKIMGSG